MKLTKKDQYLLIQTASDDDLGVFFEAFKKSYNDIKNEHLVIDLLNIKNCKSEDLNTFYKISKAHRETKKSFIIVVENFEMDDLPDDLIVVPTILEAKETIEMEEIERDLGF
jgi:hypothetical protein